MCPSPEKSLVAENRDVWSFYVFRKNREHVSFLDLAEGLRAEIKARDQGENSALDALARAGEMETGLADAGSPGADIAAKITDHLAASALGLPVRDEAHPLELLASIADPGPVPCSYPEGFSYYGLSPLDFADLVEKIKEEIAPRAAIVGIRSIGSTLGAIVAAALERTGKHASRTTVRPEGEPYQRNAAFDEQQLAWIRKELQSGAQFLVVDEGPGFSGSTFLSVAGALEKAEVPAARIMLLCSRPFAMRAGHAGQAEQWKKFRSHIIAYGCNVPAGAGCSVGGGRWRELLYRDRSQWPASWYELERIKHVSRDGQSLIKFEGLGRFGKLARDHAAQLAEAGFSPRLRRFENGYAVYEFLHGRPMERNDLSEPLIRRLARYCAFRAAHFPAASYNPGFVRDMVRANLRLEFGLEQPAAEVPVQAPVYADCRMMPHEWIRTDSGEVLKTDSAGHGDAHLLPGPVDIAWDLAGTIVEWQLDRAEAGLLLREYFRQSGDDATPRIGPYVLYYSIFRMAFLGMAAASLAGTEEAVKLDSGYHEYSAKVSRLLSSPGCVASN